MSAKQIIVDTNQKQCIYKPGKEFSLTHELNITFNQNSAVEVKFSDL